MFGKLDYGEIRRAETHARRDFNPQTEAGFDRSMLNGGATAWREYTKTERIQP
jgi:hypothetical protein